MKASRILSRSAVILAARVGGAGIMFLAQAMIARKLGSETLGQYTQSAAAINIIAAALPLGFNVIASYFAVEYATHARGGVLRRFFAQAVVQTLVIAAILLPVGWLALGHLESVAVAGFWTEIVLMSAACAVVFVCGAVLAALRKPVIAFLGDGLLRPLIVALSAVAAIAWSDAASALHVMLWTMALAYTSVAAVYLLLAGRSVFAVPGEGGAREARRWWRFALPWTVVALATDYFFDLQTILLSGFLSYSELAIYGIIARIFALAAFGAGLVFTLTLPDVFEAEAKSDRAGFERAVFRATAMATAMAAVIALCAVAAAPFVLRLFGPEFVEGSGPLAVLCLALPIRSAFGPSALMLSIHDRPYAPLPAVALGVVAMGVGSFLLVPDFGLYGAAASAAAAILLWSAAMWWTALRITGVDVSIFAPLFSARRRATAA